MLYKTPDMLSGDTYIYNRNINSRLIPSIAYSLLDCINSFINIEDYSFNDAFRFGLSHPEHLEFAKFVFAADNDTDLCSAYIESDYYFFMFHGCTELLVVAIKVLIRLQFVLHILSLPGCIYSNQSAEEFPYRISKAS